MKSSQKPPATPLIKPISLKTFGIIIITLVVAGLVSSLFQNDTNERKQSSSTSLYTIDQTELDKEAARLEAVASKIDGVASADIMMRSSITHGQQVIVEAVGKTDDEQLLQEALLALMKELWNNRLYRPTDIRANIVSPNGTSLDAKDLGFKLRGANPRELYDRFGPAAADPDWRP